MAERVVLCMKWGTLYSAKYVNILHRAVKDHLSYPFRFVCLTDDADGLDPEIEHHPIPDLGLPEEKVYHGAWPKLSVFGARLYDLTGRCLFIDLDSVIVGPLDPFFEVDSTYHAIGGGTDWRRGANQTKPPELLTGVFGLEIGSHPDVLATFMEDQKDAFAKYLNEQEFVEGVISDWRPWPDGWIVSFKRHLRRSIDADLLLPVYDPPADAKIVAFHGDPRPIDLVGRKRLWIDAPHSVRCPVTWLDAYWSKYGG